MNGCRRTSRTKWILIAIASAEIGCVDAASTPARLLGGEQSIESQLELPSDLPPRRYVVHCEVVVGETGRVKYSYCYALHNAVPRGVVSAVRRATERSRFAPAMRDGKPAAVYMVLMARIDMTPQGPLVLVVPNNGVDAARYGLLYSAPQRFNEFSWGPIEIDGEIRTHVRVWWRARIDEQGHLVEYSLTDASHTPKRILKEIESGILRMEFIPGFSQGKPAPMVHMEAAYWN